MAKRFSYQLYSSRNHGPLGQTLAMLARHGYSEVEGYGGVYGDPAALRAQLDEAGLTMPSGHFSVAEMETKPKQVLKTARTIGMHTLVMPYLDAAERPSSARGWKALAKRLNAIATTYRREGFGVAWHNHDFEFVKLKDGGVPMALIIENAPLLDWEIDVAWVARGGANPLKWIKDYGAIITIAHVKDIAPKGTHADEDGWSDVGHGTLDWPAFMAALAATRCMHYVMEHDNPADDQRFAKRSIAKAKRF
jgi:sugar phosphate isomerase/epimerase